MGIGGWRFLGWLGGVVLMHLVWGGPWWGVPPCCPGAPTPLRKRKKKGYRGLDAVDYSAFFTAVAMDTAGSKNGISVDWKAWYRSDLPGQTVPITWLFLSS